jgi:soluble lytic murein transglycosylase-like protein
MPGAYVDRAIARVERGGAGDRLASSVGCFGGGVLPPVRRLLDAPAVFVVWLLMLAPSGAVAGHFDRILATGTNTSLTEWGRRYENGEGVPADVARAIRLYCKAAMRGHADAQYYLGRVYASGRGVSRDDALAAAWFKRAAGENHPQSRNLLKLLRVKPKGATTCPTGGASPRLAAKGSTTFKTPAHLEQMVRTLAPEFRLDPALVLAVVQVESNFNANARSPKNAQGLMQLIPETAERFGVRDVWDPEENLRGGMAYLRWLLDHFEGDVRLALAGYNAGEGAVQRHEGVPPFAETQEYVRRITGLITR